MKLYKIIYDRYYTQWTDGLMTDNFPESLFKFITTDDILKFMAEFEQPVKTKEILYDEDKKEIKIEREERKTITDILFIDRVEPK